MSYNLRNHFDSKSYLDDDPFSDQKVVKHAKYIIDNIIPDILHGVEVTFGTTLHMSTITKFSITWKCMIEGLRPKIVITSEVVSFLYPHSINHYRRYDSELSVVCRVQNNYEDFTILAKPIEKFLVHVSLQHL